MPVKPSKLNMAPQKSRIAARISQGAEEHHKRANGSLRPSPHAQTGGRGCGQENSKRKEKSGGGMKSQPKGERVMPNLRSFAQQTTPHHYRGPGIDGCSGELCLACLGKRRWIKCFKPGKGQEKFDWRLLQPVGRDERVSSAGSRP